MPSIVMLRQTAPFELGVAAIQLDSRQIKPFFILPHWVEHYQFERTVHALKKGITK